MTALRILLPCLASCILCLSAAAAQESEKNDRSERDLFSFDSDDALSRWKGQPGKPRAEIVPVAGSEAHAQAGPAGHALRLQGPKGSFFYTRADAFPAVQPHFGTVRLWLRNDAEDADMEIQFLEADGKAKFWRLVQILKGDWRPVVVPLRFMRWSQGRRPEWRSVCRMAFYFRTPAAVTIDSVRLVPDPLHESTVSPAELSLLAFPQSKRDDIRIVLDTRFFLLTDSPRVEIDKLTAHLETVIQALEQDFPFLAADPPHAPPALLVFDNDKDYRAFPQRIGEVLLAQAPAPESDGYTLRGTATAAYDDRFGDIRPVYTHEFVHAWLEMNALLPSGSGDWVQEGIANLYQLRHHPQENIGAIVRQGMASSDTHMTVRELCSGQRLKISEYWQALTFMQMLLETPRYQQALPTLFSAFRTRASTDLQPLAEKVLKQDVESLSREWNTFCLRTYRE